MHAAEGNTPARQSPAPFQRRRREPWEWCVGEVRGAGGRARPAAGGAARFQGSPQTGARAGGGIAAVRPRELARASDRVARVARRRQLPVGGCLRRRVLGSQRLWRGTHRPARPGGRGLGVVLVGRGVRGARGRRPDCCGIDVRAKGVACSCREAVSCTWLRRHADSLCRSSHFDGSRRLQPPRPAPAAGRT